MKITYLKHTQSSLRTKMEKFIYIKIFVAIKKTLGASEKSIVLDLTKKFLIISAIAVLISIPISYYFMNEWLKDFAYRIEMPWFPYVLSFVILLLLTFAVVSIKAYRATQVNLVKYLKYE